MNKKTSSLQKRILTTLFQYGLSHKIVSVVKKSPDGMDIQYQLEKQKLVDERGGQLVHEESSEKGYLVHSYKVSIYRLKRTKLSSLLFNWEETTRSRTIRMEKVVKPKGYSTLQVVLTNSLKSLKAKGYVGYSDYYGYDLKGKDKKQAQTIELTTEGIKKAETLYLLN